MLAIILGILKFIGLLLLGILGLAVAIVLLVLLVPVRYRARGSYYGDLKGTAGVSWLLHILSFRVKYEGGSDVDVCIRVFGIRLGGRNGPAGRTPDGGKSRDAKTHSEEKPHEAAKRKKHVPADKASDQAAKRPADQAAKRPADRAAKRPADKAAGQAADQPGTGSRAAPQKEKAKRRKFSFGNPLEKIRVTFRRICGKLKTLGDKKDQILDFIGREENKNTFRLLKKQVISLLKHILPRRVKGRIKFGFDDPYTTGQVLTWISPFYGLYAKKLQLTPVFTEKALEGELELLGRIRVGTLAAIVLRIFLDKNFRKLLKKWREA